MLLSGNLVDCLGPAVGRDLSDDCSGELTIQERNSLFLYPWPHGSPLLCLSAVMSRLRDLGGLIEEHVEPDRRCVGTSGEDGVWIGEGLCAVDECSAGVIALQRERYGKVADRETDRHAQLQAVGARRKRTLTESTVTLIAICLSHASRHDAPLVLDLLSSCQLESGGGSST